MCTLFDPPARQCCCSKESSANICLSQVPGTEKSLDRSNDLLRQLHRPWTHRCNKCTATRLHKQPARHPSSLGLSAGVRCCTPAWWRPHMSAHFHLGKWAAAAARCSRRCNGCCGSRGLLHQEKPFLNCTERTDDLGPARSRRTEAAGAAGIRWPQFRRSSCRNRPRAPTIVGFTCLVSVKS